MQQLFRGETAPDDVNLTHHLDRCLGCRGCEPVCPSGVTYGEALEEARHRLLAVRPIPAAGRLLLAVMADPVLRWPAMALARLLRPLASWFHGSSRLGFLWGMLGATKPLKARNLVRREEGEPRTTTPPSTRQAERPAFSPPSAIVFRGCIMDGVFGHVNNATERVLTVNGYALETAPAQGCCGALHAHAGDLDGARELARGNVAALSASPGAVVVVNSAGCGAMLRQYGSLLAGDPLEEQARALASRVRDVSEVLAAAGPTTGAALDIDVAYDPPCHLEHAQRVIDEPRRVLEAIPGLHLISHEGASHCCGSAGIYNLLQPDLSRDVLGSKIGAIAGTPARFVATGNPGCLMQIGAGLAAAGVDATAVHPVELLDASYERAGLYRRVPR
jgi:glycolate oxidase iron-sulfur subunit